MGGWLLLVMVTPLGGQPCVVFEFHWTKSFFKSTKRQRGECLTEWVLSSLTVSQWGSQGTLTRINPGLLKLFHRQMAGKIKK